MIRKAGGRDKADDANWMWNIPRPPTPEEQHMFELEDEVRRLRDQITRLETQAVVLRAKIWALEGKN